MLRGGLATAIRKAWQRYVEYTGNALVCILLCTAISICIFIPIVGFRVMIMKNVISVFIKKVMLYIYISIVCSCNHTYRYIYNPTYRYSCISNSIYTYMSISMCIEWLLLALVVRSPLHRECVYSLY